MKLIELSADQPSFKKILFNPEGITLIVGDESKGNTSNGVGKTLALNLVHHCLGANINPKLKSAVPDWIFRLRFALNGQEHVIERSADGKHLYLDSKATKLTEYRHWLNECGAFRIEKNLSGLSFRSLFIRFARQLREDCNDPIKTHKENDPEALLRTLYLLGVDAAPIVTKQANRKRIIDIKQTAKNLGNDQVLREIFRTGTQPKLRAEWLDREIKKLRDDIARFEVAVDYRDIERVADDKTTELRKLEKQIAVLQFQISGIDKSLQQQPDISNNELLELYKGLQDVFKPETLAHFKEVEQFHHSLASNRKIRLESDRQRFFIEIQELESKSKILGQERDELLRSLDGKHALDEYTALTRQYAKLEEERARIDEYLKVTDRLNQDIQDLKERMLEANREAIQFVQTNPLDRHDKFFINLAEKLFPRTPAGILITDNLGDNQLRYDLSVQIEGNDSDGINNARIICFDWLILMQGSNHSIDFIWHDNRLFADLSPKPRAAWFSYLLEAISNTGKQYIASLNTENFDAMSAFLNEDQWKKLSDAKKLVLHSDKPENKLLGIQFGKIGDKEA